MEPIEILKLAKLARECKCWAAHRHFMNWWLSTNAAKTLSEARMVDIEIGYMEENDLEFIENMGSDYTPTGYFDRPVERTEDAFSGLPNKIPLPWRNADGSISIVYTDRLSE